MTKLAFHSWIATISVTACRHQLCCFSLLACCRREALRSQLRIFAWPPASWTLAYRRLISFQHSSGRLLCRPWMFSYRLSATFSSWVKLSTSSQLAYCRTALRFVFHCGVQVIVSCQSWLDLKPEAIESALSFYRRSACARACSWHVILGAP